MLLAPEGDPDAPDIPTPRSYAEAIMGPYSSQSQTAMDAEMASWKSTGTYVDALPPSWANIATPLPTGHSLSGPPSNESVEPSGPYPELVGCLIRVAEWFSQRGASGGSVSCPYVIRTGDRAGQTCRKPHTQHRCFSRLDDAWRAEFGDEAERPRWLALLRSGVGIFSLYYDAILAAMYALSVSAEDDEAERPRWAELLRCGVAISELVYDANLAAMYTLSVSAEGDYYLCVPPDPGIKVTALGASESALPGTAPAEALHTFTLDSGASRCFFRDSTTVTSTTPGGQRMSIRTCTRTGRHLATFTRRHGLSLYTLATKPSQVAASAQVSASGPVAPACSCCLLSHQTLLWHHRLGHPSLPRLRGMHSRLLVPGLPRSLPPLPPSPAPPSLPCVEGRQRVAPHSSFPPTTAPLQTLHMDVEGILQSFTLLDSSQQNGIAERRIGLVMEVARTSMIHAAAPHFLWPFAVRYAAHQLNLWPRVSFPETSPTLRWTGEVGDASVFRVWDSRAFVRDTSADKLSTRFIPCVFLGFPPDAPGWQFYHPTSRHVFPSQDVTCDESVPFYRLFPHRSAPPPPPPLFLAPGPPPIDPLPPLGPAPSGVSQVDPLPGTMPVEVAVDSGVARGAASGGAASGGTEPGGAESEGAGSGTAKPGGVEPWA
ncbi:unnamed protein product [Closterium sp. NIES-54]